MTSKELFDSIKKKLSDNSIDNCENEAYFIIEKALSLSRTDLLLNFNQEVSERQADYALKVTSERIKGVPIQYCIGEWDFYGETYKVGEGVLIPRPETEELCEIVIDELRNISTPSVVDLCSGSGCIGLTIKKNVPDAKVFLVEKSRDALKYLIQNASDICPNEFVSIVNGDVLKPDSFDETFDKVDVIVSNPPYIRSNEINSLQKEVQLEPKMALDGGEDGFDFYRVICKGWDRYLKNGGIMAFECGENQAEYICSLFDNEVFTTEIKYDFNGIDRFVIGRKKNK